MKVGIYVHHHGAGHLRRARSIAEVLRGRGVEVTLLGSRGDVDIALPRDDDGPPADLVGTTADGQLHWVPLRHEGLRERMAAVAAWVAQEDPAVMVVDVSVEVTAFVRLLGVPVVVVAQPGLRDDPAHELGCRLAEAIIAPWPSSVCPAPHLRRWEDKVAHVGGISALRPGPPVPREPLAVLLGGGDGWPDPALPEMVTSAVPDLRWQVVGGSSWVSDLGPLLQRARVVVSHAGQNAVADLAALEVPAVVVPQPRPSTSRTGWGSRSPRAATASPSAPPSLRTRGGRLVARRPRRPGLPHPVDRLGHRRGRRARGRGHHEGRPWLRAPSSSPSRTAATSTCCASAA
ncbi:glycosyltransferase [Janibacter melonis]|uniref:glycosyltransferase n=1 Tax=Janibacter melonis TaxID=262209 RepID=UPI002096040F|nr:glycosyltransferase [Janibacter melonis]